MEKSLIEALARAAGLERALAAHPDCVAHAAAQAQRRRAELTAAVAEPWPPMRMGDGA